MISGKRYNKIAYLYILPAFAFLLTFIYYGVFYNIYIGLFKWNGISEVKKFVGLENFLFLLRDSYFKSALLHTISLTLGVIFFSLILGFFIAIVLNLLTNNKLQSVYKGIFFLPHIIAQVIIGIIFRGTMFEPNFGFVNKILGVIGLDFLRLNWLGNPNIALYSVIAAFVFTQVGFAMIIYYTSLLSLPEEIFDAARVDGAGFGQIIFNLIFPLLRGTHVILIIFLTVNSTKLFDLIWVMTEGGPANSTEIISTYIYRQSMIFYNQGKASAISSIILLLVLGFSVLILSNQMRYKRRESK